MNSCRSAMSVPLRNPHPCPAFGRLSMSSALRLQRTVGSTAVDDHQKWKATAPKSRPRRSTSAVPRYGLRYLVGSSETKRLSSALQENSGVPMAGAVSTLLRVILAGLLVPDTQRQRGISGSGRSRLSVRCFQPRQGSNASVGQHCGSFASTGVWSSLLGLIRKAILKQVKTEAESTLTQVLEDRQVQE